MQRNKNKTKTKYINKLKYKKLLITKKILLNKKVRLFTICSTSVLLITMGILLMNTMSTEKFIDLKSPEYSYNNKAEVNYQVFLKPNSLYPSEQKSIGEGNIYVKKLVDYIDTNFVYEFKGQSPVEVKGKYSIKAVMEGQLGSDKAKKTVWKHEEQLLPEKSFNLNSDNILEAKSQINPQHFQDIADAKSLESDIAFETKLTIYWNVEIDGKTDKGVFNGKLTPTMDIPINSEKYFQINGDLISEKKGAIETATKIVSPTYKSKLSLYSLGGLIWICSLLFTLLFTEVKPAGDVLQLKLKRIFKDHGDRLVRLVDEKFIGMVDLVYVKEFEDLVRIADDVGRPIFYKDREDISGISTFYVLDDRYVYTLELKDDTQVAITIEEGELHPSKSGMFIRF
jgi:hypothetical protein